MSATSPRYASRLGLGKTSRCATTPVPALVRWPIGLGLCAGLFWSCGMEHGIGGVLWCVCSTWLSQPSLSELLSERDRPFLRGNSTRSRRLLSMCGGIAAKLRHAGLLIQRRSL